MVKYLDGLCSKTFKDEPRGWEILIDIFPTWWEEFYKLLEFVKRWSEIPKKEHYDVVTLP